MTEEQQKINGEQPAAEDKIIDVGALVQIDDEVMKHGVLFTHPKLPPFKLRFLIEDGQFKHFFEVVGPAPEQPKVQVPKKKLILPGGNA